MRLILSRKGFDSSFGGIANAILPDGRLCWFPIPEGKPYNASPTYEKAKLNGVHFSDYLAGLSRGKITGPCHLDPDLRASNMQRQGTWRACFGQCGAAQTHLASNGVGQNDLFLFFGWYRKIEQHEGAWRFVREAPDLHVIFGWLQVGEIFHLPDDEAKVPPCLHHHPHFVNLRSYVGGSYGSNTLYAASERLVVNGTDLCRD